jgi:molybdopterin-binding protein
MKISARNVLKGTVKRLEEGAVNTEVTVELAGGDEVVAVITRASARHLELKEGGRVNALIKASSVMLAID